MNEAGGADDKNTPEPAAARRAYMPSSIGMSILLPLSARRLTVTVRWGDYRLQPAKEGQGGFGPWQRTPHEEQVVFDLPAETPKPREENVPGSNGLRLALSVRPAGSDGAEGGLPVGTRSVSVFLVNRRRPAPDEIRDEAFAFQTQLEVASEEPLVPRPNLRSLESSDWDERVADLQYRDVCEFAVGHSVATEAVLRTATASDVRTCWIPEAEVERVAPAQITGVELSMDALAELADGADAKAKLGPFVIQYRALDRPAAGKMPQSPPKRRRDRPRNCCDRAEIAADRIEQGIDAADRPAVPGSVSDRQPRDGRGRQPPVRASCRARTPATINADLAAVPACLHADEPAGHRRPHACRPRGRGSAVLPHGRRQDRSLPGPGGLHAGPAAAAESGIASAGLSVLMRYTLRLLTLDQLGRAATLICALELERQKDVDKLGDWPFEIGLWVGQAATPNRMGVKGDNDPDIGPRQDDRLQERRPQALADPAGRLPVVRHEVQGRTRSSLCPTRTPRPTCGSLA